MASVECKNSAFSLGASNDGTMSEEEALRIRRLLTLYLASLITFPNDQPSHFQLCHPQVASDVKSIPKEVIGLRRQYLKELQANIKARQNYEELLASGKSNGGNVTSDGEAGTGASRLETHLRLLQMRKRLKEVQITRRYLDKLRETNPAKDGGLDFRPREVDDDAVLPDLLQTPLANGGGTSHRESTEELTRKLERAVIRAKYQLEREESLLAEVKSRQEASKDAGSNAVRPGARIHALAATRDELVRFLEEKMSSAGLEETSVSANAAEEDDEPVWNPEEVQKEISAEYERYLQSRKKLLNVAAKTLAAPPESRPADAIQERNPRAVETEAGAIIPVSSLSSISPLPFISEQVLPLLQRQKAKSLQEVYAATVMKTERTKALDSLERLADESHLLPAYPIMARQERFRNVAAALGRPRKLDHAMVDAGNNQDEMIRRAEAWAFAAEEAKKAEEEFVEEKVRYGNERLDRAGVSLGLLDDLLGRDPKASEVAGDDSGEADIWLEAVGAGTQNAQSRRARASQQEKGPWAGLNGRIGLVGEKQT